MSTKDSLENIARNTWLAGLGSIDSSREALIKSIDAAQEKSNNLYNDLQTRGEVIQSKINDKKDEIQSKINATKDEIQSTSKLLFGKASGISDEAKLAQLNTIVDKLTSDIAKLIEARNAKAIANELALKEAAKKSAAAPAPKKAVEVKESVEAKKTETAAPKARTTNQTRPKTTRTRQAKPAAAKQTAAKTTTSK